MKFNDIMLKALLYALPLFLAPFVDKMVPIFYAGNWPSPGMYIGCGIVGLVSMCIGLRAFFDGSYERKKTDDHTQFLAKPTETLKP